MQLSEEVRAFWEREPCGTGLSIFNDAASESLQWHVAAKEHRYRVKAYTRSLAQFTHSRRRKLLEVGAGAGTNAGSRSEPATLLSGFRHVESAPMITPYDTRRLPCWLAQLLSDRWGWFIGVRCAK